MFGKNRSLWVLLRINDLEIQTAVRKPVIVDTAVATDRRIPVSSARGAAAMAPEISPKTGTMYMIKVHCSKKDELR